MAVVGVFKAADTRNIEVPAARARTRLRWWQLLAIFIVALAWVYLAVQVGGDSYPAP